jgi:hypothetical protein
VEALKSALRRLEVRLAEARGKSAVKHSAGPGVAASAQAPAEKKNKEIERLLGELKAARGRR